MIFENYLEGVTKDFNQFSNSSILEYSQIQFHLVKHC